MAFLSDPRSHLGPPAAVEAVETHMSWIFLAGDRVYKLKKPVRFPFLDFRDLAARRRYVEEEVRLNRRLAPDAYLGALPLALDPQGRLALGAEGLVVDWLVQMRRLPRDRMLDRLILDGAAEPGMIDRLGDLLLPFYRRAASSRWPVERHLARFAQTAREDEAVLLDPALAFADGAVVELLDHHRTEAALVQPLIVDRAVRGHVVEGHGDLRPEHVCMTEPPQVFDCVEFDLARRMVDPWEEVALLGLECARLGAGWVAPALHRRLASALEPPPGELIAFYWRDRAILRARLALHHLADPAPRLPLRWRPLARLYLDLAERAEQVAAGLSDAPRPSRAGAGSRRRSPGPR